MRLIRHQWPTFILVVLLPFPGDAARNFPWMRIHPKIFNRQSNRVRHNHTLDVPIHINYAPTRFTQGTSFPLADDGIIISSFTLTDSVINVGWISSDLTFLVRCNDDWVRKLSLENRPLAHFLKWPKNNPAVHYKRSWSSNFQLT